MRISDWSSDVCSSDLDVDRALGLGLADVEPPDADESGSDPRIDALVAERQAAREGKDFATSDRIRDELAAEGIELRHTPTGPPSRRHPRLHRRRGPPPRLTRLATHGRRRPWARAGRGTRGSTTVGDAVCAGPGAGGGGTRRRSR